MTARLGGLAAFTLVLSVGSIARPEPTAAEEEFELRWKDAERNRETSAGQHYEDAFSPAIDVVYAPWLNECASKPGTPLGENFDLLLKIGVKGRVEQALVKPATPLAECFKELARGKAWPDPPAPAYWWLAAIRFTPAKP
jgi:hypothetical protein